MIRLLILLILQCLNTIQNDVYQTIDPNLVYIGDTPAYRNCSRDCSTYTTPMICYFNWTLEQYHVMGPACGSCLDGVLEDCEESQCVPADGIERGISTINRHLPGPPIHICQGDRVVVDLNNHAIGSEGSIHWHGLRQKSSPHMDGVPMVTQCPIHSDTTFRYNMVVDDTGTMFYHSHSGIQKFDGQHGAFVIHQSRESDDLAQYFEYDYPEHTLVLADWIHEPALNLFPGLYRRDQGINVKNLLINGRGTFRNRTTGKRTKTPYATFYVKSNGIYRFRIINAGTIICPMQFQIENHSLLLLALDGKSISPEVVHTVITHSGERFDIALNTSMPSQNYWIRVRGLGQCEGDGVEQFAVLVYDQEPQLGLKPNTSEPDHSDTYPTGVEINHPNATCGESPLRKCISDLRSMYANLVDLSGEPDLRFYVSFGFFYPNPPGFFRQNKWLHFMEPNRDQINIGHMNNKTLVFPSSPPLSQPNDLSHSNVCYYPTLPEGCSANYPCPCVNILKIPLGVLVELIITEDRSDEIDPISHPFHFHGYHFYVTAMGQNVTGPSASRYIEEADQRNPLLRVRSYAPVKDTISIPNRGHAITRFYTDNPGYWLHHCHLDWHTSVGMAIIIQVGEQNEMVPTPSGFPKCGDYLPKV